ncbi:Protein of unknown function [Lachnospiraceae bacterium KH1T2]|nr:Protein of unknown function [Lachnospiraceae bacterium KH1T2]
MLKLYHGSEIIIENPIYGKGKLNNDYGRGFYCTEDIELAKEWACAKGNNGYVNCYEIEIENLKLLDLNDSQYSVMNWLALLTENRTYWENSAISSNAKNYLKKNFFMDISEYDVVKGYRADDSYFSFAQAFVAGTLSLKKLNEAMRLGNLGEQIVLKSKYAFEKIKFLGCEEVRSGVYYEKKRKRDLEARRQYRKNNKEADNIDDIFMIDIMREGMKNGDPRLR